MGLLGIQGLPSRLCASLPPSPHRCSGGDHMRGGGCASGMYEYADRVVWSSGARGVNATGILLSRSISHPLQCRKAQ